MSFWSGPYDTKTHLGYIWTSWYLLKNITSPNGSKFVNFTTNLLNFAFIFHFFKENTQICKVFSAFVGPLFTFRYQSILELCRRLRYEKTSILSGEFHFCIFMRMVTTPRALCAPKDENLENRHFRQNFHGEFQKVDAPWRVIVCQWNVSKSILHD